MRFIAAMTGALCCVASASFAFTNETRTPVPDLAEAPVPWAKPLEGGPIAVLLVAPRFTLRDGAVLAQRLDVSLATVATWDATHLGYDPALPARRLDGYSPEEVLARLGEAVSGRHEAIVLARLGFDIVPEEVGAAIAQRVEAGAGLLLVEHGSVAPAYPGWLAALIAEGEAVEDARDLFRGVLPLRVDKQGRDAGRLLATWHLGKGRMALLRYEDAPPRNHCLVPQLPTGLQGGTLPLDDAFSLVSRALCWVAGRSPRDRIGLVADVSPRGPDPDQIPPFLPREHVALLQDSMTSQALRPFRLELKSPATRNYTVAVRVRNPGAAMQYPPEEEGRQWPRGSVSLPVDLRVGPGNYLVDVWLREGGRTTDWFTAPIAVKGWPELVSVVPDRTYLEPGDTLALAVETRPTLSALNHPREGTVYARALDTDGQVLCDAQAEITAETDRIGLALSFDELRVPLVKVEVYAVEGRFEHGADWSLHRAHRQDLHFPVLEVQGMRPFGLVAVVPALDEFNCRFYLDVLGRAGFTGVHAPSGRSALYQSARLGLRLIPELSRFSAPVVAGGVARQPCLSNPVYLGNTARELREQSLVHLAGGAGVYSLGYGNVLCDTEENVCQSPTCLAGFQGWVERAYGSLDRLNVAWGTAYRTWSEILPGHRGHPQSWIEFRLFMDAVFGRFHEHARSAVRTVDPDGVVGFAARGGAHSGQGYDWHALAASLDYVAVPLDDAGLVEKARCYQGRAGAWAGIAPTSEPAEAWHAWYAALHQLGGLWCPGPFGDARDAAPTALLLPDGTPTPATESLAAAARELDAGLAALLLASGRPHSPIAVYESRRSRFFNDADSGSSVDSLASESGFVRLIEGLGYQCDFIPDGSLSDETLAARRLVVLPAARALSDAEVAALHRFVGSGGALLSDLVPGIHDERGLPRRVSPFEGIFGVVREGTEAFQTAYMDGGEAVYTDGSLRVASGSARMTGAGRTLGISRFEAEAEEGGAEATELALRQGHLLLNLMVSEPVGSLDAVRTWVKEYLSNLGLRPAAKMSERTLGLFRGEQIAFKYGVADILALLCRPDSGAGNIEVEVPKGSDAYDMRSGERISRRQRARVSFRPGTASLTAVLPYKVEGVDAAVPGPLVFGRGSTVLVHVETRGAVPAGEHLVAVWLLGQDGSRIGETVFATCRGGAGETVIGPIYDQRRVPRRLAVRDVLSGVANEVEVRFGAQTPE